MAIHMHCDNLLGSFPFCVHFHMVNLAKKSYFIITKNQIPKKTLISMNDNYYMSYI